jgi:hypothetical protein
MRRRTHHQEGARGSTGIVTESRGCVTTTLAWIFWLWVVAVVLVAYVQTRLCEAQVRRGGTPQ